jgi:3-hydroxybutyryl-CoA dehydrogenase
MSALPPIEEVHILGAGRMGQGMALAFSYAGLRVTLIDFKERDLPSRSAFELKVQLGTQQQLESFVKLGRLSETQCNEAAARISIVDRQDAAASIASSRIVFEAVPEVMAAKQAAFSWLAEHTGPDVLYASTTSTFLITELQQFITHPRRALNAHWLNPAHLMPLVEISRSDITSQEAVTTVVELLRKIGKVPIVCNPAAGYIVPRIQALAMNEAARMVEEGVASVEDIDTAIRVGFGLRFSVLGLLEFIDWGGCDILYYASHYLAKAIDPRFLPADIVTENTHNHRDGLRDGNGFYNYGSVDVPAYTQKRLSEFMLALDSRGLAPQYGIAHSSQAPK